MASSFVQKLKNVGPGALVAAGFVGPGTVTTCTVSGASYGYTMLWALLFATVATIIFQEMAARIGIVTQEGLGENIRDRISHPVLKWIAIVIVIIAIFIGNTAYETGNITGGILGIQAVADVPMIPIVIVLGILAFVAMWAGSYKLVEKILTGIVIFMGLVFLITAFASPVDWGAVVAGLFTPTLPEGQAGAKGILTAVGLIGTTIVPYNLFLHASGAAERFKDPEQVSDARFDCVLSIGLGGVISMAILICAAANMHAAGITVTNGKDMAIALQPLLGNWATVLIGIGLLAAGFSSAITAPLSAAYAVNGVLGWGKTLKDLQFKVVWMIVLVAGCLMAVVLGKSPTELILVAQAANAILLPIMAFFVMYVANGKSLGKWRNHAFANICGVIFIGITLFMCWRNMSSFLASLQTLIGA
ncbi:divalent metal cation transporter [Senegalimassilia faecalis]|uniref:Divalent metal cation transporter n=1 Tax=Senegalimassilia faecalis TaxID=2509433 RepID=A0A4Q2JXX2_9ACTN|nr:Nramp family divalent metal transporter [Senegalimassilia faecalis]RXZ53905.1 divalent metal cation transporter [Senegalimassilia faecalis]